MVVSNSDGKKIIEILLAYLSLEDSMLMIEDVWEDVGKCTDNISLEETVVLFKKILEDKWEYSLPTQNDTLFQEIRS